MAKQDEERDMRSRSIRFLDGKWIHWLESGSCSYITQGGSKYTLFKSHISHKWDNIMNLFENSYKSWYLGRKWWKWHQNWWSNAETEDIFRHISEVHGAVTIDLCPTPLSCTNISMVDCGVYIVSMMIPRYTFIDLTRVK